MKILPQSPICGIYRITNLINGKCYIGQSRNIYNRRKSHKCNAAGNHNEYLRKAIIKYGFDNFSFELLKECKIEQLDELEKKYIVKFNSLVPNGYNMDLGGCERKEMGPETREKRRLASTGARNPNYGKHKSDDFKRIVAAARSKPVNQYTRTGEFIQTFSNARATNMGYKNISLCCNHKTKTAYGFQWRFANETECRNIGPITRHGNAHH